MESLNSQQPITGIDSGVTPPPVLKLGFGMQFEDLYSCDELPRIDSYFLAELAKSEPLLAEKLAAARKAPDQLTHLEESQLIISLAPHLEDFLGQLFNIQIAVRKSAEQHHELAPLFHCKRLFVQRKAMQKYKAADAAAFDGDALATELLQNFGDATGEMSELLFAQQVNTWLDAEAENIDKIDTAMRYAAWAVHTTTGKQRHGHGVLFKIPAKLDFQRLVPIIPVENVPYTAHRLADSHLRDREGFALTDQGTNLAGAMGEANYCIWCHEQGKDSCSIGLREKAGVADAPPPFKKSTFGIPLAGCPVDEKISEFHKVKASGCALGALAIIAIDNPMCAATGHRICNDCMKSCIYQKQEPVNIPQSETRSLKDVLELPWGFEIYSLLTRWNPLNIRRPYPHASTGKRVLVVGMGPAGFTLAHHLMNDGHIVVGVDGLKIEPLPGDLSGVDADGNRVAFSPVYDASELKEPLDNRVMAGFGGVAEYGITVRWDKNFLKIIRLLLERRTQFALLGGVRFGGTITAESAFESGFDHVALAAGAGRPTLLDIPNGMACGVRTASDFLMALQLTGAAKSDSIANMQVRLPVVVIGGGLTAIDTATESLAYYPVQVEKFLCRYEKLIAEKGEAALRSMWTADETIIGDEFLSHARAIRAERAMAVSEGRNPNILQLIKSWGGVTLAYRKRLVDSPSYTLNHEEVEKALEEGIYFAEGLTPVKVEVDSNGNAIAMEVMHQVINSEGAWQKAGLIQLPAHTIFVAAGTQPNTVLAREFPEKFKLDGRYFQACDEQGEPVTPERSNTKPAQAHVLQYKHHDGRFISFFGDLHPSYSGNVVKAMGSAKQGYPVLSRVLSRVSAADKGSDQDFLARLSNDLRATIHQVIRLTPTIIEVIVKAPAAARNFQPGQFYRLQNYETSASQVDGTRMVMEGLALTGAWVDAEQGLLSTIVLEMGGSSQLCAALKPGEPVVLMGPTGTPTEIVPGETVMLVGGGLGNAVLFSIGKAFRSVGSKVLYFAGYKKMIDRYKVEDIEMAADVVIWCCDEAPGFTPDRPQDRTYVGNIVQAIKAYASDELGHQDLAVNQVDRIIAIGSDRMMAAVAGARHSELKPYMKPDHHAYGSINSPMQCMMKEICGQCIQEHFDITTGEKTYVFSCFNQDQRLDCVNFPGLNARLKQNTVQEKLTAQWIEHCIEQDDMLTGAS
ncbi:FAD-dependent oxidoreductase [Candidatus Nitrotoga sp. M5]|uniref:FAD-dependent oxidoreductase n=1 Tax=Candidatus Nitrotoga sp. M5 TaxID=2890409 RepID=UPI001EF31B51|nr:FAD-dependent oxidoreductase [Candidatus Nitrotoga sp. M5]CAH1385238.1 FAD-binding FR-type domain-containing protein [Candidatus Nitrotoga sp. M5]